MKKFKKIFLAIVTLALGVSLASCKDKDARNQHVPYGTINESTVIATANNGAYTLNAKTYYDKLRTKSYDVFLRELKYQLLNAEITALTNLLYNKDSLSETDKATLAYTGQAKDADVDYLYAKYDRLVGTTFASAIYGTYSLSTFNNKTADDKALAVTKYVQTQVNKGFNANDINAEVIVNNELEIITVDYTKLPAELVKETILTQAQNLYSEKELYKIAGEKEVPSKDEDGNEVMVKNSYNVFTETQYKSTYASSLKNYGTYKAVIIQFNSYKDAKDAIAKVSASIENPEAFYLELYNTHYSYKAVTSLEDDVFTYTVDEEVNELNKISSSVATLVTTTLEDGDYLAEPRNINNKYVMAYRISTEFVNEQEDYDKLSAEKQAEYIPTLQRLIIESTGSSYASTALNKLIENSEIKVYDPFLEYKFKYSYATQYEVIDTKEAQDNNEVLFSVGSTNYNVDAFYSLMSKTQGQSVILDYFTLEYATQLVDEYVNEDTQDTNKETLKTTIKSFKNDENTTYPAAIGLETFLLANYGYTNENDVIKYFYNAASALSSYKDDIVNETWIKNDTNENNNVISNSAKAIIDTLLASGNAYNDIFSIDIDHILINIDDNGDGNPDDPNTFLAKYPSVEADFKNSVAKLAQAIYTEAVYLVEKGNTTFEAFQYIVKQYNKGANLQSDSTKNWDEYKTYNFLLTAEQLASSSDITNESVSNFVVPFANYVKDVVKLFDKDTEFENGQVVIVNAEGAAKVESVEQITYDSLCATNYGYHLLVVNEYTEPESLTTSTSSEKYNSHFIKISDGDDEESEDDDIYVSVLTKNETATKATTEQLYVYLVQKELGITSTLDSDIASVLGDLYDEAITAYTSANFQTLVLIDTLAITSTDATITSMVNNLRAYYVNLVTDYDTTSPYATWCADTTVFKK